MKYLGVDFGLRRIGLAISEGILASPWKVIEVKSLKDAADKIEEIVKVDNFDKIVVGLPEGKMGNRVRGFINILKKKKLDVESTDETLSSKLATTQMIELNIPLKKRRVNDDVAAAIILQNYLDQE